MVHKEGRAGVKMSIKLSTWFMDDPLHCMHDNLVGQIMGICMSKILYCLETMPHFYVQKKDNVVENLLNNNF